VISHIDMEIPRHVNGICVGIGSSLNASFRI
jgi:hypothetical protein